MSRYSKGHFVSIVEKLGEIHFRKQKYLRILGDITVPSVDTSLSPLWTVLGVIGGKKGLKRTFLCARENLVCLMRNTFKEICSFCTFFLQILSRSMFDHHLRCGVGAGWLNFEFGKIGGKILDGPLKPFTRS